MYVHFSVRVNVPCGIKLKWLRPETTTGAVKCFVLIKRRCSLSHHRCDWGTQLYANGPMGFTGKIALEYAQYYCRGSISKDGKLDSILQYSIHHLLFTTNTHYTRITIIQILMIFNNTNTGVNKLLTCKH